MGPYGIGVVDPYKYNGKEWSEVLGLGWYFYGFRMHDPAVGRFTGVDPIAERFAHVTTYNYAENKVPGAVDLHGLQSWVHFTKIANGQANHEFFFDAQRQNDGGVYKEIIDYDRSAGQSGWVNYGNYPSMFPKDENGNYIIPEYHNAQSLGLSGEGVFGGGLKLGLGYTQDNLGNWGIYFNVGGRLGLGFGAGLDGEEMQSVTKTHWLHLEDDIEGKYTNVGLNFGPIGLSTGGNVFQHKGMGVKAFSTFGDTYKTSGLSGSLLKADWTDFFKKLNISVSGGYEFGTTFLPFSNITHSYPTPEELENSKF